MTDNFDRTKEIDPHKPLTQKELDAMGPWMHGLDGLPPDAQAAMRRFMGRPRALHPKEKVTVRFDHDVLVALRAKGKGWQTRLNALIRDAIKEDRI